MKKKNKIIAALVGAGAVGLAAKIASEKSKDQSESKSPIMTPDEYALQRKASDSDEENNLPTEIVDEAPAQQLAFSDETPEEDATPAELHTKGHLEKEIPEIDNPAIIPEYDA